MNDGARSERASTALADRARDARPARLLQEGAAECASLGPAAHDRCAALAGNGTAPDPSESLDDEAFAVADIAWAYPIAASFVAFLIERAGVAVFKPLYASPAAQTRAALERLGLGDATALEREWRARVRPVPARRSRA